MTTILSRLGSILLVALIVSVSAIANAAPDDTVRITGTDGLSKDWSLADLKSTFASQIHSVDYTSKGVKHTSSCIPLIALLNKQAVPTDLKMDPSAGPKKKNANLRLAVIVQGADGYTITFSLGELMTDIGNHDAWVVLEEDGKPLDEKGAPVKLVMPGDGMPARNVHGVANIAVVDASLLLIPKPTTQPAQP